MNESFKPGMPATASVLNDSCIGLPRFIISSDSFLMRSGIAAIICSANVKTFASDSPGDWIFLLNIFLVLKSFEE